MAFLASLEDIFESLIAATKGALQSAADAVLAVAATMFHILMFATFFG